jgi:hypothetical protein
MAVADYGPVTRPHDKRLFDRQLFRAAAIVFPLIVLAGFSRTYYLKFLFAVPALPSWVVHVHGVLMTAWVALFVSQVALISTRRVSLHRRLGYAGAGLAVAILGVGFVTAVRAAKFGSPSTPPGIPRLAFLLVPMFDLLMFAILFGAAMWWRRRPAEHKRLMLLTAINFVPPAIARIPIASLQALGPIWFFGLPTVLTLLCVGWDTWRHDRLNRAFVTGAILLIASYVGRLALMGTDAWMGIAAWLVSFV